MNPTAITGWRKSRACANQACAEVAVAAGAVHIRNNTDTVHPDGIAFDAAAWTAFIGAVKVGGITR